jgi:hypothetical protein
MSNQKIDWADDEGSSDDEDSVDEQPQKESVVEETRQPERKQESIPPVKQQQRQQNRSVPDRPPFLAYVGNLNYAVTVDMLGDFFHKGGCYVKDVVLQTKEDGQPRGAAIVEFGDRESLVNALDAHDVNFEGRRLHVAVSDRNNRRDKTKGKGRERDRERVTERDRERVTERDRDRGDRRSHRGGQDSREEWSRNEQRGGRNNNNKSSRGPPPPPNPSSTDSSEVVQTRKKLELTPRQAPINSIGERVAESSIFGEGKPREENLALSSLTKDVKEMKVNSSKTNKEETPNVTANEVAIS